MFNKQVLIGIFMAVILSQSIYCQDSPPLLLNDLENFDLRFSAWPSLNVDDSGIISLLYVSRGYFEFLKYDRAISDTSIFFKWATDMGPDLSDLHVANDGTNYCVFGSNMGCSRSIVIITSDGKFINPGCPPGTRTANNGCAFPGNRYLFNSESPKGIFNIMDHDGQIEFLGKPKSIYSKMDAKQFIICRSDRLYSRNKDTIFFLGQAISSANAHCGQQIGVAKYCVSADSVLDYALYALLKDKDVIRTDMGYDKRIRIFPADSGKLIFFAGYVDSGATVNKMCYFTIDKDLKLVPQNAKTLTPMPKGRSLTEPDIEQQLLIFDRFPMKESGLEPWKRQEYSGKLWHYQITKDKIYYWSSTPIRNKAYDAEQGK